MPKKKPKQIKIVAFDPSMNNWGIAIAYLNPKTYALTVRELIVVNPNKLPPKPAVRKSTRDIHVANSLFTQIVDYIDDADVVVAETPIGGRDAKAALGYAICVSVIGILNEFTDNKILEVSPFDVKNVVKPEASKDDIISWAFAQHPEADWQFRKVKGKSVLIKKHAEHCADAIAALYACANTKQFTLAMEKFL